jgi:MFS family permease
MADDSPTATRRYAEAASNETDAHETRQRRWWTIAILLFIGLDGVGFQMRGALIPRLEQQFGVSESLLGLIAPAGTVGFLLTVITIGTIAGRVDMKRSLLFGAALVGLSAFFMGLAPTFFVFLLFLFFRSLATGLFRGVDRPILSHLYPDRRGRVFNLYDLVWAIGAATGPLLASYFVATGNWRWAYIVFAASFVPLVVAIKKLDLTLDTQSEKAITRESLVEILKKPQIIGMSLAMFIGGGVEGGIFTWLPYYVSETFAGTTASTPLSLFLLAYIPGRLVYTSISERINYINLVSVIGAALVPIVYVTFNVSEWTLLLAGIAVMGMLVSGVYPNMVAFGTDVFPSFSGPINAIATTTFYGGIAFFPVVMGVVADYYRVGLAMRFLAVLSFGFALVVLGTNAVSKWERRKG